MRTCPNCHNETGLSYMWDTDIVRCPQCDLGYRDTLPTLDELAQIYSDEQYFNGLFYADYVADKVGAQLNLRHRLNKMREFQDGGEALFEAGCAHGFFLELAQASWKRVQGIDMSAQAVAYAQDWFGSHNQKIGRGFYKQRYGDGAGASRKRAGSRNINENAAEKVRWNHGICLGAVAPGIRVGTLGR